MTPYRVFGYSFHLLKVPFHYNVLSGARVVMVGCAGAVPLAKAEAACQVREDLVHEACSGLVRYLRHPGTRERV